MKEVEDKIGIISLNERKPDLEAEVMFHLARINAENPFKVTKKYSHIVIPDFKPTERREKLEWELEEIRRCENGYDGLPGRYYYYFNHCYIKHKSRKKIRPDFRATQLHLTMTKERIYKTPGLGLVMIKRRQYGESWATAADNIYDCQFNHEFDIGMNSKSETDSRNLFTKHKYIHRNQTPFLRCYVHIDRRDAMIFGKWVEQTKKWKGTLSSITSVAPTVTGHAGNQYIKLVIDEAGEQPDLLPMWSNAEDCIMQETERVGCPMIFGTVGEMSKAGKGLLEFWKNHKTYNLERFAIWGYNCMLLDELGNDDIENSLRWIIYTRKKKESGATSVYQKFIQKYPITEYDAFLDAAGGGVGDPITLGRQRMNLIDNPPVRYIGNMRPRIGGGQDHVPDGLNGKVIAYELPDPNRVNGYIITVDPAEDDDVEKSKDTSNLSTSIIAKPFGLEAPKLVLEYCDRPKKLHEYYYNLALILQWYNNSKLHIELNKGGWRMLDYFQSNYPHLLALAPSGFNSAKGGVKLSHGYKITPERKIQMKGLGDAYVENYVNFIPSIRLIDELGVVGAKGKDDDLAMAFLAGLMILQGDHIPVKNANESTAHNPTVEYKKVNGVIQLVSGPGGQVTPTPQPLLPAPQEQITGPRRGKSALFKF